MNQITKLIEQYRKEQTVFNPEKALRFLDMLIYNLRVIESKSDYFVYDYFKDEYFSVDSTKVQDVYDRCYQWDSYTRLEEKNIWVMKLRSVIQKNTSEEDFGILYYGILFFMKSSLTYAFPKRNFSYDSFVTELSNYVTKKTRYNNCKNLINILIDEKLFIVSSDFFLHKFIEISDDTVRFDLTCMSTHPVCIVPQNNEIKFSCLYALSTLPLVISNFLSTDDRLALNGMLQVYIDQQDEKSFNKLKNFYLNKNDMNYYEIQKDVDKDSEDYNNLIGIYGSKIILHDYFFQVLILSPFQDYYVDVKKERVNILYNRQEDFKYRLCKEQIFDEKEFKK